MNPYILILGSGRSGTTFLAKLLDSSPSVLYRHEPDIVHVNKDIPFLPTYPIPSPAPEVRDYLLSLIQVRHVRVVSQLPVFKKSFRNPAQNAAYHSAIYAAKSLNSLPLNSIKNHLSIPDFISSDQKSHVTYVVKSVTSLCRAELFSAALPHLKIIHLVRNPCGVIASLIRGIKKGVMSKNTYISTLFERGYTESFPYSLDDILSRSTEEQMAFQWMAQNNIVYERMKDKDNYRIIRYEDVCRNSHDASSSLMKYCDLEMTDQSHDFLMQLDHTTGNHSGYFSTMRPLQSALNKWRHDLSQQTILNIAEIVRHSDVGRLYKEELEAER